MPSRHTTVEITSVQIKRLELSLQNAFTALCEWQKLHIENVVEWKDTFKLPDESKYAALVKTMDQWDAPESQITAILGIFDALDVVKALEQQLFKQHGRKQPGEKIMADEKKESFIQRMNVMGKIEQYTAQLTGKPTPDEVAAATHYKMIAALSAPDLAAYEASHSRQSVKDALAPKEIALQPTVAALREYGKSEPEWVQEASAYKRSRDPGEFSDERRAQMDKVKGAPEKEHVKPEAVLQEWQVAMTGWLAEHNLNGSAHWLAERDAEATRTQVTPVAAKEHAKPEAVHELDRDDGYEMEM